VTDPRQSAEELLAKAAGFSSARDLLRATPRSEPLRLAPPQWDEFARLCRRRAQHEPVQYLVGEWDFHDVVLSVEPPVLIPRPETEELIQMVLDWWPHARSTGGKPNDDDNREGGGGNPSLLSEQPPSPRPFFLDVGAGTGAIGLALLNRLPNAACVAIDPNPVAVSL
ncbi:unnamed protein product, partial [Phaeothamnion confervicola]